MALREVARRYGITALIVTVMLGVFIRLGYVVADGISDPFIVEKVEVLTPRVKAGEQVRVVYNVERRRYCTTSIAQFWIDRDTGQAMFRDRIPGGYTPIGKRRTTVALTIPFPAAPGRYTYRSVMESDCGVSAFTYLSPDVEFEVVAN